MSTSQNINQNTFIKPFAGYMLPRISNLPEFDAQSFNTFDKVATDPVCDELHSEMSDLDFANEISFSSV